MRKVTNVKRVTNEAADVTRHDVTFNESLGLAKSLTGSSVLVN